MATKVILGDILFDPAPRQKLKFNNPRVIAKLDIPGAPPVNQDMGEDETTLAWDGILVGADAYRKAIQIESLKDAGQVIQLIVTGFPELCKKVRIRSFPWDLVRQDRVEYSIELVAEIPPPVVSQVITTYAAAPSDDVEQASSPAPSGNTYVVKEGDTLWDLAVQRCGDGTRWREIADANGIMDPTTLQIGQEIVIPF
ncbi:LysM peptidoglycan-binding domain-containing protein [Pelotomaculum propionicicum]|uniref:LysM domain-containing protein n=1 Tax=Pelotomaculum propionicicum TaxID=258475 RepID=A0A4Y7RKN4_9FIRM|nr:LysM domain-containing protein [Pelotomaculum propionicicum]TEB09299.1 hypothetical protein Pmgp_03231 [Pelotomaculum propionicicum]